MPFHRAGRRQGWIRWQRSGAGAGWRRAPRADQTAPAAGGAEAAEEKDSFDVVLESAGDQKIQVIKEVRALTNLGLGEAKAVVDGAPATVLEGANKETAEKAKAALEAAGAKVTLK